MTLGSSYKNKSENNYKIIVRKYIQKQVSAKFTDKYDYVGQKWIET